MDDLSLDHDTLNAQIAESKSGMVYQPDDPWLARRQMHIGGSDVPVALLAMGLMREPQGTPQYITKRAKAYQNTNGQPRIVYEKAGLLMPYRAGGAATIGSQRERELLDSWKESQAHVVPESIKHASELPQEWFPLVDRHAPALAVTPDAIARTEDGELVCLEMKCSSKGYWHFEANGLPWYWKAQAAALVAAQGIRRCLVIVGCEWARHDLSRGPVYTFTVEPTQSQLDLVRKAATLVMERVRSVASDA